LDEGKNRRSVGWIGDLVSVQDIRRGVVMWLAWREFNPHAYTQLLDQTRLK